MPLSLRPPRPWRSWLHRAGRRVLPLLLAVSVAETAFPRPLQAQTEGDGLSAFSNRLLASCNYVEYIERVNTLARGFYFVKEFKDIVDALFRNGFLSFGMQSVDLLRASAKAAYKKSLDRQFIFTTGGIVYQFEQACKTFEMAIDTERQLREIAKASFGARRAVKDVITNLNVRIARVGDRLMVVANTALIERAMNTRVNPSMQNADAVFAAAMDTTALRAIAASTTLQRRLAQLGPAVQELKRQMFEYATRNAQGQYECPKGYDKLPDPIPPGMMTRRGIICGGARPARAAQINALLQTMMLEEQGLTNGLKAQALALSAMRALRDAQDQRRAREVLSLSMNSFTQSRDVALGAARGVPGSVRP